MFQANLQSCEATATRASLAMTDYILHPLQVEERKQKGHNLRALPKDISMKISQTQEKQLTANSKVAKCYKAPGHDPQQYE